MHKRLFTFGCSFTRFGWPTWADIMAWDLNIPNQNWGVSGLGNVGLFHRLVECDLKNKFTDDDLIIVLWAHWNREDRYKDHWQAHGNVLQEGYYSSLVKKYWSLDNDIVKNSTAIIAANKMYNINFQSNIIPLLEFEGKSIDLTEKEQRLFEFYKQYISDHTCFDYDRNEAFGQYQYDDHPTVLHHLNFLRDQVYPSLSLEMNYQTVDICHGIHRDIIDMVPLPKNKDLAPIITTMIKEKYNLHYRQPVGF